MKKSKDLLFRAALIPVCAVLFLFSSLASDYPDDLIRAKNSITADKIISHIGFLASKHCRGRETGMQGMDVAAEYITTVFAGAGLEPSGEKGRYFQDVRLKEVSLSDDIFLEVEEIQGGAKVRREAKLEWDFLPVVLSAQEEVTAPLVFAGYGITAPEHNYDDYKNLNAKDRIVLVMRHEPREVDPQSPFDGQKLSEHATLLSKILNAQKHGAVGILFATDPLNHEDLRPSATGGTRWPSLEEKRMRGDEDFRYMDFSPSMRIVGIDYGVRIPAVALDGRLVDDILGEDVSLVRIQEEIDRTLKPRSFPIPNKKISVGIYFRNEPVEAYNIIAKVEGSDPELKDEVVIVGGHYDHEGKDNRGQVYPGADDNASGTAGILELARAFQSLETKPKRSILFILFTAEEKGLLGARYYVQNPLIPLDKTVAMINLDMIGRNDVEQLSLIGRYQYPKLFKVIDSVNKATVNFDINFAVEQFILQSDHVPFMREDIPSVFFNTGDHPELHTPRDTVDLIIPDKVQKVTHLIFLTLWEVANAPPGTSYKGEGGRP